MQGSPSSWPEILEWRKRTRAELLERRMAWPAQERNAQGQAAKQRLLDAFDLTPYAVLGIYWPFRGEIDVRDIAANRVAAGCIAALPVVVTKGAAVEFWQWQPGMKLDRGIWNIPIPSQRIRVQPDALIVPLVGFDLACFRLGYGGGYYDRTLQASSPRPFCIGLGYANLQLATIHPQPHDIPMDAIVTEASVLRRGDG